MFQTGIYEKEIKWTNYENTALDTFKYKRSWTLLLKTDGLDTIFNEMSNLWNEAEDIMFVRSAIQWYLDSNRSQYSTSGVIKAQIALELIYNWLLVEKLQIITVPDAQNISASNKIRLVLNQLGVDYNIPPDLENLLAFAKDEFNIIDGPEAITYIRNAITHAQLDKRRKISELSDLALNDCLNLSLFYVEISLLYIFKHVGKFSNRCIYNTNPRAREMDVPWINKNLSYQ